MPGTISEHRVDVLCGDQGIEPGIKLFGRCAADPFSVHRRQFSELQSRLTQKRLCLALGDPGGLALFHPDLRGGTHHVLHRLRVRPRPPQRGLDALGRQADLLNDVSQYVATELRLRNSGNQKVVLILGDILAERAGQRQQGRAHIGTPR